MAKNMFQLVIAFVVLLMPASAFARELINNGFDLSEVLQTQESKAACEEYHRLVKSQIKGKKQPKKSAAPCLFMCGYFVENTFLCFHSQSV